MEWVVGQWVDYRGEPAKIEKIDNALTVRFMNGSSVRLCLETAFVSPFVWQVGKTYRTTREGVTATIVNVSGGVAFADACRSRRLFCTKTGVDIGLSGKPSGSDASLLPLLADEPSEPEPALTERYTDGQLGTLWGVFDRQSMIFARFSGKEVVEYATCCIDEIHDELAWWRTESVDLPEADTKLPVAQPDPVNPQHYRYHPSGIECIQVAEHMSYCLGNAIKYLWRAGKKGDAVEDLKKAAWYVNREIERLAKGGAE